MGLPVHSKPLAKSGIGSYGKAKYSDHYDRSTHGTLFPDGRPAPFLHVPNLNALATGLPVCPITPRALYVAQGGRLLCQASCPHERVFMTMLLNFHQQCRLMHITCGGMAGSVACLGRCILLVLISCMGLKSV